jgi:hypothetical protein
VGIGSWPAHAVVLTHDTLQRGVTPDGRLENADDWHAVR